MTNVRLLASLALFTAMGGLASEALAQAPAPPAPPPAAAPPAAAPPADPPAAGALPPAGDPAPLGPGAAAAGAPPDRLREALRPVPRGLTPAEVGRLAAGHSPQIAVAEANVASASGQVVQTIVQYVPRVTLTAQYTRLSEVQQGSIGGGGGIVGAQNEGLLRTGPCPDDPAQTCVVDSAGAPVGAVSFEFPQVLNQYQLNANVNVPITDYFFRAVQSYQASSGAEEALELSLDAARLQAQSDAKLAFYQWIQARGQSAVTAMSVEQAQAQVADAKVGLGAGTLSRADLMRVEAQLAQAQFTDAEARAIELTAEERLRTLTGMPSNRPVGIGIDVFVPPPVPQTENLDALLAEASRNRLDLASARAQEEARDDAEDVAAAGYLPRIDAFGNATYANPNQRVFPQTEEWRGTWDVGVRATWVLNETFSTIGAARAASAQTAAAKAQRRALEDAIRLEVTAARSDIAKAAPSLEAATRGLAAAEESYRVTKQLFAYGKATAVSLTDAEVALTNARLRMLAAHVNLLSAIERLEHAVGRDRRPR